jgi:hypothetical protein
MDHDIINIFFIVPYTFVTVLGGRRQHQISMGYPYFSFFISHFSVKKFLSPQLFSAIDLRKRGFVITKGSLGILVPLINYVTGLFSP